LSATIPMGLTIEVEGPKERVETFLARLRSQAPPLARIDSVAVRELPLSEIRVFGFVASEVLGRVSTGIPAGCGLRARIACGKLLDPKDRRIAIRF